MLRFQLNTGRIGLVGLCGCGFFLLCSASGACAKAHEAARQGQATVSPSQRHVVVGTRPSGDAGTSAATAAGSSDAAPYDAAGLADAPGPDAALTLTFGTIPQGGKYAPTNGGVAWVEDEQGKWVHTFEIWISTIEISYLKKYIAAGGPNYAKLTSPLGLLGTGPAPVMPPPDVISSATYVQHKLHSGDLWNLKDANGTEVPDGNYRVVIEVCEDTEEHAYEFAFEKTGQPFQSTPPDSGYLVAVTIIMQ